MFKTLPTSDWERWSAAQPKAATDVPVAGQPPKGKRGSGPKGLATAAGYGAAAKNQAPPATAKAESPAPPEHPPKRVSGPKERAAAAGYPQSSEPPPKATEVLSGKESGKPPCPTYTPSLRPSLIIPPKTGQAYPPKGPVQPASQNVYATDGTQLAEQPKATEQPKAAEQPKTAEQPKALAHR